MNNKIILKRFKNGRKMSINKRLISLISVVAIIFIDCGWIFGGVVYMIKNNSLLFENVKFASIFFFVFIVASSFIEARIIVWKKGTVSKEMYFWFLAGLTFPLLDVLLKWSPAVLKHIGLAQDMASKLVLESFADDLTTWWSSILPTIAFYFSVALVIFIVNRLMVLLFRAALVPVSKEFAGWWREVFRY